MSRLTALLREGPARYRSYRTWIRGADTRSWAERRRDWQRGESGLAHVIGDSHASTYRGVPGLVVHSLPGTTMHRVARDRGLLLDSLQRWMGPRSTLVFVFGGVDTRRHVGRVAEAQGLPLEHVAADLAARYLDAIDGERRGRSVVVLGALPPGANEHIDPRFGYWGTQAERARAVRCLNASLESGCLERGFAFVDLDRAYADASGYLRRGVADDGVHLLDSAGGAAIEGLKMALARVGCATRRD